MLNNKSIQDEKGLQAALDKKSLHQQTTLFPPSCSSESLDQSPNILPYIARIFDNETIQEHKSYLKSKEDVYNQFLAPYTESTTSSTHVSPMVAYNQFEDAPIFEEPLPPENKEVKMPLLLKSQKENVFNSSFKFASEEEEAKYLDMVEVMTEYTDSDFLNSTSSSISSIRSISSIKSLPTNNEKGTMKFDDPKRPLLQKHNHQQQLITKKTEKKKNNDTRPPFLPTSKNVTTDVLPPPPPPPKKLYSNISSKISQIFKNTQKKSKNDSPSNSSESEESLLLVPSKTRSVSPSSLNTSPPAAPANTATNLKKVVTNVKNTNSEKTQTTHAYLKRKSISFVISSATSSKSTKQSTPPERLTKLKAGPRKQLQKSDTSPTLLKEAPASSLRSSSSLISSFVAEFNERKKKVEFVAGSNSIATLHAIERKIKEKFQIDRKQKIGLSYFDREYKQWLEVDNIKELQGAKVKVSITEEKSEPSSISRSDSSAGTDSPKSPFRDTFEISKGWIIIKTLGVGSFGNVMLCFDSNANEMMAVKKILYSAESQVKQKIEKETTIMKSLNHENIVRFKGVEFSNDFCFILMEFLSGGSLKQVLKRMNKGLSEAVVQLYLKQILVALKYLHEDRDEPIYHRDLKSENILLKNAEIIKLADFGEAKLICKNSHLDKSRQDGSLTKTKAMTGTIPFLSIEQLRGETCYKRSHMPDIWSLGMTILEMLIGRNIWFSLYPANLTTEYQYVEFMINNTHLIYENIPSYISPQLRDLITKCLSL